MTEAVIEAIRNHEQACRFVVGAAFQIRELYELAPGVIAALDDDGEYTLYFDQQIAMKNDAPLPDVSSELISLATGIGFIECLQAQTLAEIAEIARVCLEVATWHDKPKQQL